MIAGSGPSATERRGAGASRLVGDVLEASTRLLANSSAWVGDLVSTLSRAADSLLGGGDGSRGPPANPLGEHGPLGPVPPVPAPAGSSAPGGLSFGQSSSFGHASKHLFDEFGTLVSPTVMLMQGGKAAWPRHEPAYPGSADQNILERPG